MFIFNYRNVSEKELLRLSKKIETSFYTDVGINLDISRAELGQIKERSQNSSDALLTVFTRWETNNLRAQTSGLFLQRS